MEDYGVYVKTDKRPETDEELLEALTILAEQAIFVAIEIYKKDGKFEDFEFEFYSRRENDSDPLSGSWLIGFKLRV